MGFAGRRCMRWRGFARRGGRALQSMAVRRCGARRWGGSGAMEYSVRERAPSLHFFTFMGLFFVKYWVIIQM